MAKFKVVLEFHYDSEESLEDWNVNVDFDKVTTKEQALEVAYAEMEENSPFDFHLDVKEINE